jgi:hypothetical protein
VACVGCQGDFGRYHPTPATAHYVVAEKIVAETFDEESTAHSRSPAKPGPQPESDDE